MSTLSRLVGTLARNPRVRRETAKLAKSGWDALQSRSGDTAAPTGTSRAGSQERASSNPQDHSAAPTAPRSGAALPDRSPAMPLAMSYSPSPDGQPDPGEVVWAWVPFEEDRSKGKDRPLLVLALEGAGDAAVAVGLMLTSRDRGAGDHTDEHGNRWIDIGTGAWDRKRRPSEVRIDRLIQVSASSVRREGGSIGRATFERVAKATRDEHGW